MRCICTNACYFLSSSLSFCGVWAHSFSVSHIFSINPSACIAMIVTIETFDYICMQNSAPNSNGDAHVPCSVYNDAYIRWAVLMGKYHVQQNGYVEWNEFSNIFPIQQHISLPSFFFSLPIIHIALCKVHGIWIIYVLCTQLFTRSKKEHTSTYTKIIFIIYVGPCI